MKSTLLAASILAASLCSASVYSAESSLPAAPMVGSAMTHFARSFGVAYADLMADDMEVAMIKCDKDKACRIDGIIRAISHYFAIAGYSYDATVRSYNRLIKQNPAYSRPIQRTGITDLFAAAYFLATDDEASAAVDGLVASGVMTTETIAELKASVK